MMSEEKIQAQTARSPGRHALIMLAGCLLPLVALGVLWLAGVRSDYLLFGVVLLCPLAHVFMMRGGHRGH